MPACDLVMLDDIEDIIKLEDLDREERLVTRKYVVPRPNIKRKSPKKEVQPVTDTVRTVERSRGSIIPGTQKIFVKTWGCTHNNSDSEYMTGQLASYGYKIIGTLQGFSPVSIAEKSFSLYAKSNFLCVTGKQIF